MQLGSKDENFSKSLVVTGYQVFHPSWLSKWSKISVFFFKTALISKNRVKSQFFWGGIENFVEVEVVLEAPVKADELEVTITGEVPIIFRVKQFHQSAGCLEAPLPPAHACLETMAEDSEVPGSEKTQRQEIMAFNNSWVLLNWRFSLPPIFHGSPKMGPPLKIKCRCVAFRFNHD